MIVRSPGDHSDCVECSDAPAMKVGRKRKEQNQSMCGGGGDHPQVQVSEIVALNLPNTCLGTCHIKDARMFDEINVELLHYHFKF